MIQMAFFLRFRPQLQRTRPELIPRLEDMAIRAAEEARGKLTEDRNLIRAVFDENSLGFWLDMLLLIESLKQTVEEAASDLYGYSLLLGKILPEMPNPLYRFLAGKGGGVFLDQNAAEALRSYVTVEEQGEWVSDVKKCGGGPFSRLREIKIFVPTAKIDLRSQENIRRPEPEEHSAFLLTSQFSEGMRDRMYPRITGNGNSGSDGEFLPLFVRFGNGGLNALTDAWAGWMHSVSLEEEISPVWEFLFRERLKDKPSVFTIRTSRRFFQLLLALYRGLAYAEGKTPVVILENIQAAGQAAADIVIESLRNWQDYRLLGIYGGEADNADMEKWKPLFHQVAQLDINEEDGRKLPELPLDLWEVGYACSLFGQYFPPELLPRLLEEAGKSSKMITRSLSLLYALRVIDTPLDPRPWHRSFRQWAESVLGERKLKIQALVRRRLLAWVTHKKINPCIRLLEIIKELNGMEDIDDNLVLYSIQGELTNIDGVISDKDRYDSILNNVTNSERAPIFRYILETLIALHSGNIKTINAVCARPPPDSSAFPLLKAHVLLNQALYHLGLRDTEAALEAVKRATLLCQRNNGSCIARAYRLCALASLLQKRIGETIDYLGFALDHAIQLGGFQEIGMAAYYAASVQLLYGNLSRSQKLAEKARGYFLKAGYPEWADRSRFLEGRLAFETGIYQKAADIFEGILQNPEGNSFPEKNNTLAAWAYRAQIFCQSSGNHPRPRIDGIDIGLFEVEALYIAGDYTAAADISGALLKTSPVKEFYGIEWPNWNSGFSQCELLFFSLEELRERMLRAYNTLAYSHLSSADKREVVRGMQRLLRGTQFPEIDPGDVTWHYAWYWMLEQFGSSQVDISTAVSVAYKRLQSRAGRIDDPETRRQYLTQPRWNHALDQAARKFKLI